MTERGTCRSRPIARLKSAFPRWNSENLRAARALFALSREAVFPLALTRPGTKYDPHRSKRRKGVSNVVSGVTCVVFRQCSYFPGMRDLRESKLVAEKNQKWSGRPLCNPNQNTFTFTGCRSQCTGARGVIWIMVRSFAHTSAVRTVSTDAHRRTTLHPHSACLGSNVHLQQFMQHCAA